MIMIVGRLFLTGTIDFREVERTSATISEAVDPVFRTALKTFKSQLRGTPFQNREELKFAVCSAVAKFGVDFYKDAYNELNFNKTYVKCMQILKLLLATVAKSS